MSSDILFERDFLYHTENSNEPGSVHIQVFSPDKNARIPVIIEPKTCHSPLMYIDTIVRIMQSDIFDRIFIDIKKKVDIYIKTTAETAGEYGSYTHIKINFTEEKYTAEGVNW